MIRSVVSLWHVLRIAMVSTHPPPESGFGQGMPCPYNRRIYSSIQGRYAGLPLHLMRHPGRHAGLPLRQHFLYDSQRRVPLARPSDRNGFYTPTSGIGIRAGHALPLQQANIFLNSGQTHRSAPTFDAISGQTYRSAPALWLSRAGRDAAGASFLINF